MTQVTLREYLQSIEDALTSEQVEDALSRCQYVQTQFPDALEVQRLLGESYLKQGMIQQAQQAFDWVLTNDPENVVVYCDRALISERISDYDTALDCYQQAYELSRGNSAIRQQFNMLSSRTGQQGFMLSRAGLARLYMRGDLLSQAAQEWEIVLNMTPERLDARTGLLETYWREGLDERVEQLAHQILRDIPECLKALLLLAHVTAPRDMQQARELIERAEMLDPDLVLAHELFGDAIAAQPSHPFWKLVNKSPVVIEQALTVKRGGQPVREPQQVPTLALHEREQVLVPDTLSHSSSSQSSSDWNGLEGWQPVDVPTDLPQEASSRDWYSALMHQEDVSHNAFAQEPIENRPTMEIQQQQLSRDMLNAEVMQQNDEHNIASSQQNVWESSRFSDPTQSESQGVMSSHPEWLSMLTQEGQHKQEDEPQQTPSIQSPRDVTNVDALNVSENVEATSISDEPEDAWRLALQTSLDRDVMSNDDEEESFFGPEWLKSLGAASIDMESQAKQEEKSQKEESIISHPIPSEISEPVEMNPYISASSIDEADVVEVESAASDPYEWIHSLAASATSSTLSEQEERNLLTTLEGLEQDLRRQGFIPLEPNTLSSIAQTQPVLDEMEPIAELDTALPPSQERTSAQNGQSEQDMQLSSVLAQLGSYASAPKPTPNAQVVEPSSLLEPVAEEKHVPVEPSQELVSEHGRTGANAEAPSWLAQLSNVPSLSSVDETLDEDMKSFPEKAGASAIPDMLTTPGDISTQQQFELPSQLSYTMAVEQMSQQTQETPKKVAYPSVPVISEPTFVPTPLPVPVPQSERQKPTAPFNEVFSDDLEVTMRRPAVRLQPVQQARKSQEASPLSPASMNQKPLTRREEARPMSRSDSGTSNQERLRRGYQHQLVGDYDEAMQEYRIIIRNAPELLGEIVSNVRALLKLAPRYSAGYRVLGDAYMRQGEYLQAMDAYNQALAITKKARV